MLELDASIGRRKSPLDRRLLAVANALPLVDSLLHLFELVMRSFNAWRASTDNSISAIFNHSHAPAWNEFLAFATTPRLWPQETSHTTTLWSAC